jgi:HK97 family phage major capsid protein
MSETVTAAELRDLKESVEAMVEKGRKRYEEAAETGKATSEGIEAIKADFSQISEKIEKHIQKQAETEARQNELELLMARIQPTGKDANGDESFSTPEYRKAFKSYMRRMAAPEEALQEAEVEQIAKALGFDGDEDAIAEIKAASVGSNPDLGFIAPVDFMRFISMRMFETSPIRPYANVISTAREAVEIIIDDNEADAGWEAELDTPADTDTPQIGRLVIPTHELRAMPKATTKMLDDASINVEQWLRDKVAARFGRLENSAFIAGDGVKKPTGILSYADWAAVESYERNKLATISTESVATLAADDLIATQGSLLEDYQMNARWLMHRLTWFNAVLTLKDNDNQYLINPQLIFSGSEFQLLGRPVTMAGDMPTYASGSLPEDEIIATYGDYREGYTIVDRIGIRILRDPYTSKGSVKFYTTKRTGGAVTNFQAIKRLRVLADT